jgi:large subunit ribosomal protein L25
VDPEKPLQIGVPVTLKGIAEGVKNQGGILDFMHREVNISCLMADIPEGFEIDISELTVGQNVSVGDLVAGERIEILDDPQTIIAVISAARIEEVAPTVEEEEEAAAAEAEGEEAAAAEGETPEPKEKQE